ncbi:division/cell wall cluster transcriptional repressor MraZ [Spiroplasma sp. AdecLV25b]|uniref:division/cell wall cluster transcriptional repressor MraZ n=1 Tax=Spiroplasma sp. AdecLV25b TaxID=3027162 RepID=UPI0027DFE066|nr:division/cell wall cluster transcriptional repressor MraZ [Spiroplasma sp. AdecLV25b]
MGNSGKVWVILMLLGQAISTIDEKKRMIIPAKFRGYFHENETVVVSKGFEGCLVIRNEPEFIKWQDKILKQSEGQKEARILARQVFANSEELKIDGKGRINIPHSLLILADIKQKVIMIGLSNKIEIWSETNWNRFNQDTNDKFELAAATLDEI